jgi:hypothetical protein
MENFALQFEEPISVALVGYFLQTPGLTQAEVLWPPEQSLCGRLRHCGRFQDDALPVQVSFLS